MVPGIAFITVHIQLAVSKSCQHTGHSTLSSEVDINASNRATTTVIPQCFFPFFHVFILFFLLFRFLCLFPCFISAFLPLFDSLFYLFLCFSYLSFAFRPPKISSSILYIQLNSLHLSCRGSWFGTYKYSYTKYIRSCYTNTGRIKFLIFLPSVYHLHLPFSFYEIAVQVEGDKMSLKTSDDLPVRFGQMSTRTDIRCWVI